MAQIKKLIVVFTFANFLFLAYKCSHWGGVVRERSVCGDLNCVRFKIGFPLHFCECRLIVAANWQHYALCSESLLANLYRMLVKCAGVD